MTRFPPPRPDGAPGAEFTALDADVPLLLLPVRLETRFLRASGALALRIRIYPDQIHLDGHDPALTAHEQAIGRAFWTSWYAAPDDAGRDGARAWLVARIPARRAAWVARQMRPAVSTTDDRVFPHHAVSAGARQARAAALPDRWAVIGYTRSAVGTLVQRFLQFGAPIPNDLRLSLDPAEYDPWSTADGVLPVDPGLAWMVDYPTAVAQGMAITVDAAALGDLPAAGLAQLVAVGVSSRSPQAGAAVLRQLWTAHLYTDGLAFVPQGTPTNNTDQVRSGWSFAEPDAAALLARELDGADRATAPTSSGQYLAAALGAPGDDVLARLEYANTDEEAPAEAMNRVLWPVTWGQYFNHLLANESGVRAASSAAISAIEARFYDHVRGGAALPALRVGAQPYGVLPARLASVAAQPATSAAWTEQVLLSLRTAWTASLPSVARMDPVLGASGGDPAGDATSRLIEILATLPHPRRFLVRGLRDWRETSSDPGWAVILALLGLVFLVADDPLYGHSALSVVGRWGWARYVLGSSEYLGIPAATVAPIDSTTLPDPDAQIAALQVLRTQVGALPIDVANARAWIDYMIGQVEQHKARQSPLDRWRGPLAFTGVLAEAVHDPTMFYSLYDEDDATSVWNRALVQADGADPGATAAAYLASLSSRVPVKVGTDGGGAPRARVPPLYDHPPDRSGSDALSAAFHATSRYCTSSSTPWSSRCQRSAATRTATRSPRSPRSPSMRSRCASARRSGSRRTVSMRG
jgi:hypothetical protein